MRLTGWSAMRGEHVAQVGFGSTSFSFAVPMRL